MTKFGRFAAVLLIGLVLASLRASAVGTLTSTFDDVGGSVTRITLAWTSTAGGAVSANAFAVPSGRLLQVKFVPASGGTQPSDLYDVTLVDANSVDVLNGLGANLSNATSSVLQWNPPYYFGEATQTLDLVVANAGSAKTGTVYLWVQR